MHAVSYRGQNLSFSHLDHLCFDQTTCNCDKINGLGGPFIFGIIGLARPLMYPDQISCNIYISHHRSSPRGSVILKHKFQIFPEFQIYVRSII